MKNSHNSDSFQRRHIGPNEEELETMLAACGASSLDALVNETIPQQIRIEKELDVPEGVGEFDFLERLKKTAGKNKIYKSYLGQGYYDCITPPVILRNILENPGWYTQYTPYQPEISQGRLEALLNFQTMIADLSGMEIANASLLDESTAAAEAMTLAFRVKNKRRKGELRNKFFVSDQCFSTTIAVLKTRAEPLGIEIIEGNTDDAVFDAQTFGGIVQYPNQEGLVCDYTPVIQAAHDADSLIVFAADLLSLVLLKSPGELGADVVIGSAQRFGVPLGFGGPHAAFFATKEEYAREVPGRVIGVTMDVHKNTAYRMALQTREQHIKRDRATSNICTAQALLAIIAGAYGVYHGPVGLQKIAETVHKRAQLLSKELSKLGYEQVNEFFFDTIKIKFNDDSLLRLDQVQSKALGYEINFREMDGESIGISVDETTSLEDIMNIFSVFEMEQIPSSEFEDEASFSIPESLIRENAFMTHPVFHRYHSETKMLRYLKSLENKDLSLTASMIPLGSCTMKLNATTQMIPVTWENFYRIHPFAPSDQTQGYTEIIEELSERLCEITGLAGVSMQPNSGAQGEYTGLLVIRAYHQDQGNFHRNVVLIPSSAHGTNPASAAMSGMEVVVVQCDEKGNIDLEDLTKKAIQYQSHLAGLMVTYPSTHGVFEESILEVCNIVHEKGGQIYMDGANMNAQVGFTSPGKIGADVCHLNLHKTFSIPHGGGGPGMGPICVAEHLVPFLPGHPVVKVGGSKAIAPVAQAPWGSANILLISYGYIQMLGLQGIKAATEFAILNANYIKDRLAGYYPLLFEGKNGRVAHELIFDMREFKHTANIEVTDIAKRLMDYGFHAPTVSFPVVGTMMIEPTESEDQGELDRFCTAMILIRQEIKEIEDDLADRDDNVLKNAPHTSVAIAQDDWSHPYSRKKAAFPVKNLEFNKYWPSVGRINESYGDRHLFCACPPIESWEK
ncbi:MAG: aminomethyl-transferring glycine dehydrogenase [SAR324 cluster bacterium]|nr:aminomethyl-transferring glycine dehydrogenase [SAR324 cluster bacterium]